MVRLNPKSMPTQTNWRFPFQSSPTFQTLILSSFQTHILSYLSYLSDTYPSIPLLPFIDLYCHPSPTFHILIRSSHSFFSCTLILSSCTLILSYWNCFFLSLLLCLFWPISFRIVNPSVRQLYLCIFFDISLLEDSNLSLPKIVNPSRHKIVSLSLPKIVNSSLPKFYNTSLHKIVNPSLPKIVNISELKIVNPSPLKIVKPSIPKIVNPPLPKIYNPSAWNRQSISA